MTWIGLAGWTKVEVLESFKEIEHFKKPEENSRGFEEQERKNVDTNVPEPVK